MSFLSPIIERISSAFERWRIRRQEEKKRKELERKRREEQERREEEQRRFLYRLGNDFEDYVITMFDPDMFELIHRTPTNDDTNGRFVHSMVYPDLRFREKSTGRKFWVEVKYRARADENGSITWCNDNQLRNYKRTMYESRDPVFIMIGVGGSVRSPASVYLLNLERINFTTLFYSTYHGNRVFSRQIENLDSMFEISELRKRTDRH